MKPNKPELRTLLHDVLPSTGEHCGPARASVIEMVRQERSRRHRTRAALAAAAVLALATLAAVWQRPTLPARPIASAPEPPPPLVMKTVNDEQLSALLQGTPAALIEWPSGERTLLVVMK